MLSDRLSILICLRGEGPHQRKPHVLGDQTGLSDSGAPDVGSLEWGDVVPEPAYVAFNLVEALVHLVEAFIHFAFNFVEALVDSIEALVNLVEVLVDLRKVLVGAGC